MDERAQKYRRHVNLVLSPSNKSWIIGKIAERLAEELTAFGEDVTITEDPVDGADFVHHMSWAFARHKTDAPSSMFITHLDDIFKMNEVRDTLSRYVDVGICMSRDTMDQLRDHGVPETSLTFVNPAHDGLPQTRRTVIGLTTRLYPDGRKRESLLVQVARRMALDGFEFQIFGGGWDKVIPPLEAAGAFVIYHPESLDFRADYARILDALQRFDYYLYLGMDEGSLGTLDALAAGVQTIITPQGFHLDAAHGITHPVVTADDLERTFRAIDEPRRLRQAAVAQWTWRAYADHHREIWNAIIEGEALPAQPIVCTRSEKAQRYRRTSVYANALSPKRMLSALSHIDALSGLRRRIREARNGK